MRLAGNQFEKLASALSVGFPTIEHLERMVRYKLDSNVHEVGYGNLSNYVYRLIQWAEAQGKLPLLVSGARQSNPGNLELFDIAHELDLTVSNAPEKHALERIIKETNSFLNINDWRKKLAEIEFQVCRIEIKLNNKKVIYGTGFLIGPDVIITNYHVMKYVIENEQLKAEGKRWADTNNVILRFDYKVIGENNIVNPGTVFQLSSTHWLLDASPASLFDTEHGTGNIPSSDQLDYALLRVAGSPGNETIGKSEPGGIKRGWVKISQEPYDFPPDSPLLIVQHPRAEPLKLAFDTESIIGLNENGTRVKYKTNTEPGSSGSPCFNINWELIALHHLGDPDFSMGHHPTYNQGIPFNNIYESLREQNLLNGIHN